MLTPSNSQLVVVRPGISRNARRRRNRRQNGNQTRGGPAGVTYLDPIAGNTASKLVRITEPRLRNQTNRQRRNPPQQKMSDAHSCGFHLMSFFDYMVLPETTMPQRVPDGHAGTTAVFKSPYVVSLPYSGVWNPTFVRTDPPLAGEIPASGYSEVILTPGSASCIYHTLGVAAEIWAEDVLAGCLTPTLAAHPSVQDLVGGATQVVHGLRASGTAMDHVAVLPKRDNDGRAWFEINFIPADTGVPFEIIVSPQNTNPPSRASTNLTLRGKYADASVALVTEEVFHNFEMRFPIPISGSGDSTLTAISFEVSDLDPSSHWTVGIVSAASIVDLPTAAVSLNEFSACGFSVHDAPELDDLAETLVERQAALAGLITYVGSTLQDGGQIASARLGMGISPFAAARGDVFTHLASLPFYNNDFALRSGIYTWWLPDSIQEHFYRPYRKPRTTKLEADQVLHYAMRRDNPNQAVRLKSVHGIEVITRSRLYSSRPGPTNPSYEVMIGLLKNVPAVVGNPVHRSSLMGWLKRASHWIAKPANWAKLIHFGGQVVSLINPQAGAAIEEGADVIAKLDAI
jgi:hypothetical protein